MSDEQTFYQAICPNYEAVVQPDVDAVDAVASVDCPLQVVYGERDTTADWEPVVERARELDWTVEPIGADHHFVGQASKVGECVGSFLARALEPAD